MRRVMIDIETLSLDTSNAVVVSVGAVAFSLDYAGPSPRRVGEWVLPIGEQVKLGRTIDDGTLKFWRQQSSEATQSWNKQPTHSLFAFCADFTEKMKLLDEVWAYGVCFDINNIESIFKAVVKNTCPWSYRAVRDCRTVRELQKAPLRNSLLRPARQENMVHDAIDDCVQQIWDLWERVPLDNTKEETNAKESHEGRVDVGRRGLVDRAAVSGQPAQAD